jgi:hypothetical protein
MGDLDRQDSVMHAMASILVRGYDILACMSEDSQNPTHATVVAQRLDMTDEDGEQYYEMDLAVKVANIANPEESQEQLGLIDASDSFVSVPAGTKYWPTTGIRWVAFFEPVSFVQTRALWLLTDNPTFRRLSLPDHDHIT